MEDCAPGEIVAVDFGSTHVAAAIFGTDGPEEIEMGKSKGEFGDESTMTLYPLALIFAKPPEKTPEKIPDKGTGIKLAGFRPSGDKVVYYGIKQALDVDLCKSGSQGALMRTLSARYGPIEDVIDDNLTKIFALVWEQIANHIEKKGYGPPKQVWITVPAVYTQGRKGLLIQERLERCAISGGFSAAIGLKSEMEAVFHYLSYSKRKAEIDEEPGAHNTLRNAKRVREKLGLFGKRRQG